ncbi:unnamed protein product [Parnassius apollo]|uniref:(apollo) hypothetical protein n=1 Tax=Parnassius apollo TaxID=110799 RepID=A0A8S3WX00_PARAO|nr:unnamed protein product [Parnassius apollo]
MVVCGKCCEEVSSAIQCSVCRKFFNDPCSGITEIEYCKLGDRQSSRCCVSYKTSQQLTRTGSPLPETTRQPTINNIMVELQKHSCQLLPLQEVINDIRIIKNGISDLRKSNNNMLEKLDSFEKRLHVIENAEKKISSLKEYIKKMEAEINEKDQWLRSETSKSRE